MYKINPRAMLNPWRDFLSYRETRPELFTLLCYQLVAISGFTLIMPLVAGYFVKNIGMTAAFVGLALAVRQMIQQGLTFIGGMLSDRFGLKPVLCTGLVIRALGFFWLGWANEPAELLSALVLTGLGGTLFEAPFTAAIISLTKPDERKTFYLLNSFLSSLTLIVVPLFAIVLLWIDFKAVSLVAGFCFISNVYVAIRYFPKHKPPAREPQATPPLKALWQDKRFVYYALIMNGFWFVAIQMSITFPLRAQALTGTVSSTGIFFTLNAAVVLLLQYGLVQALQRHYQTSTLLMLGTTILSFSTFLLGCSGSFGSFLWWIVMYSVGHLIARPMIDLLTAHLSNSKALGLYAGIANMSIGVGGGLGHLLGGWLYDMGQKYQLPMLAWTVFLMVGLLTVYAQYRYFQRYPDAKQA
ncbi:MAG: MFS transporter [Cardiobacteriaceae bacterium]|nr:MFS transporter [Cardiobacteriaceae bacterium]